MSNPTTANHILVIDDEDIVREAIIDILESIDISVLSASSGQEGIASFRHTKPPLAASCWI
jgi:CheY-like chemotaxis protein